MLYTSHCPYFAIVSTRTLTVNPVLNARTLNAVIVTSSSMSDELISSCQWECKQSQYKRSVHCDSVNSWLQNYDIAVTYTSATVLQHLSYSRHNPLIRLQQICTSDSSSDVEDSDNESSASFAASQSPMSSGSSFHCRSSFSRNCSEVLAVLARTCPLNSLSTCC